MGDRTITLICPNSQCVMVPDQGGGGTYLGVPEEGNVVCLPYFPIQVELTKGGHIQTTIRDRGKL